MPLYEYRCQSCGAQEEKLQGFSAPESHDCPKCQASEGMRRQISRTAFALAGNGWYASGYGEGGKAEEAPKGESKAEAKPEAPSTGCGGGCACH
jgi:putative FmdB family regulatory protein